MTIQYNTKSKENYETKREDIQQYDNYLVSNINESDIHDSIDPNTKTNFYKKNKNVLDKFDKFFRKIELNKAKKAKADVVHDNSFDEEIMMSIDSRGIKDIMYCDSGAKNDRLSSIRYNNFD